MRIYVASSWRNERQPEVVKALRDAGYSVYDFREPEPGVHGFHWSDIDPEWQQWTPAQFRDALNHPLAVEGFQRDLFALQEAQFCVLVQPCGISAHLELGWAEGAEKFTAVLLADGEPELMYGLVDHLCVDIDELLSVAEQVSQKL